MSGGRIILDTNVLSELMRPRADSQVLAWFAAQGSKARFLVTAITQAGLAGLAISSDEIVKPTIRVIATVGDKAFMELRPRTSLVPGEYAIIGDDLARIATFRVATNTMR